MKKGKSRNKRKKTRSRLLWIAIAVIGIAAVISAVCVAGMLATKENAWKTPKENKKQAPMDCDCCYRNICSMRGRNVGIKRKCLEDTRRTSGGVHGSYSKTGV